MTTLFNTGRTTSGGRKQTNRVAAVIWMMFMMMGFISCNEILELFEADTPTITTQPQAATYTQNTTADALTVTAKVNDDGTLSYQWYSNTANSTKGGTVVGTNSSNYTPTTTGAGTTYYYVVVTNTWKGGSESKAASATSNVAAITVNEANTSSTDAQRPSITAQPQGANYSQNATANALRVTASVSDGGTLSYQWYRNTTNSASGGTAVGTNSNSYTPPTTATGTTYYYVVVTNTNNSAKGAKTATSTSVVATVTVNDTDGDGRVLTLKEKELVGVWVPRPEYKIDYAGGIEFKEDGTFFCIIKNNSGVVRGEITQKGNFKVQEDKIICTKVLESWKQQGGNQEKNYTDKAIADLAWKFYFSQSAENEIVEGLYPGLSWLAINILPAEPDDMDWFTKSTVK